MSPERIEQFGEQHMRPERIEQFGEQLRAKITSKFTASTFLAGFALTVLTGQISTLWQVDVDKELSPFFSISVGAVAGAFYLFVMAVIRLDELTMPKLFWDPRFWTPTRPPSDDLYLRYDELWKLQSMMVRIWFCLSVRATIITAIALLAMLIPPNFAFGYTVPVPDSRIRAPIAVVFCTLLAVVYCRCAARPFKPD